MVQCLYIVLYIISYYILYYCSLTCCVPIVASHDYGQDTQAIQASRQAKDSRPPAAGEEGHPTGVCHAHMLLMV